MVEKNLRRMSVQALSNINKTYFRFLIFLLFLLQLNTIGCEQVSDPLPINLMIDNSLEEFKNTPVNWKSKIFLKNVEIFFPVSEFSIKSLDTNEDEYKELELGNSYLLTIRKLHIADYRENIEITKENLESVSIKVDFFKVNLKSFQDGIYYKGWNELDGEDYYSLEVKAPNTKDLYYIIQIYLKKENSSEKYDLTAKKILFSTKINLR